MKHSLLRSYMKKRGNVPKERFLTNCTLIVDGDSFIRKAYIYSGCKFLLGGEFDRFADYLKRSLLGLKESKVTCYVVFKGISNMDIGRRKMIYQKLIDDKINIAPGDGKFYEPIFVKDTSKQVLEDLGFKYYVCENDARATLLDLSKKYNCPVLTDNVEYCLLGMPCITPDTLIYDSKKKHMSCKVHTPEDYKNDISIFDNMKPMFMTIVDENGPLFELIPEIICSKPNNPVGPVLNWIIRQKREEAMEKLESVLPTDAERKTFQQSVNILRKIIFYKRENHAVAYFETVRRTSGQEASQKEESRQKGFMSERVAKPYINLKRNGTLFGSWVIYDKKRQDAMLPALDIVLFANMLLKNARKSVFTFIGRNGDESYQKVITKSYQDYQEVITITKNNPFSFLKAVARYNVGPGGGFALFVDNVLPGFNWLLLKAAPENCWLLIITLVFYITKTNRDFVTTAYSILLSYVTLGHISERVGLIKRSNIDPCHSRTYKRSEDQGDICTFTDSVIAAYAAIDYFYEGNIKKTFNRNVLQDLAEFQHCWQHMNYLNKLCGEHIQSTNYYKSYNGTFVFNTLLRIREHDNPMLFVNNHFKNSPSVLQLFICIKDVFENCLASIHSQ